MCCNQGGGGWKRVLKNLVFNKDLLDKMEEMKTEYTAQSKAWTKRKSEDPLSTLQNASRDAQSKAEDHFLKDTDPALKLEALTLIEELLFCASWYLSDQFLRAYRGDGEMQLRGFGNPFKDGEGFDFLRDRNKSSQEAVKAMTRNQGSRAGSKADFRTMTNEKMKLILQHRWGVPEGILEKLDRRKLQTLLQKKSSDAMAAGSKRLGVERYARITGSRKQFSRRQYTKKLKKLMKAHLAMLRGKGAMAMSGGIGGGGGGGGGDEVLNLSDLDELMDGMEDGEEEDEDDGDGDGDGKQSNGIAVDSKSGGDALKKKKRTKRVRRQRFKVRYTLSYNDPITGERVVEIEEFDGEKHPELLSKMRMCLEEGDTAFTRLNEYSRLHQKRLAGDDEATAFQDQKQRLRFEKMERIRKLTVEQREEHLMAMEERKPHITCSSCRRKGHNSNNKYCPNYHDNQQRKNEQNRRSDDVNYVDTEGAVSSFIDRAIVRQHGGGGGRWRSKRALAASKRASRELSPSMDPRLEFVMLIGRILTEAVQEVATKHNVSIFKADPTELPQYAAKVKRPQCLQWIEENIEFTAECIKAPYKRASAAEKEQAARSRSRGRGKPKKTEYLTFSAFAEDVKLILTNCRTYNGADSAFCQIAQGLVTAVEDRERKYKELIGGVAEKVKERHMTLELQPILDQIINGILKAPILSLIKSSEEIRNGRLHQANIMGLYEIRQKVHDRNTFSNFGDFVMQLKQLQQCLYDAEPQKYNTEIKTLAEQFKSKVQRFKESLKLIDPDAADHFELNKLPPFI